MKHDFNIKKIILTVLIYVPLIYLGSLVVLSALGDKMPLFHACHLARARDMLSVPGMMILTEMIAILAAAFFSTDS